jgi:hypothetical protein
MAFTMSAAASVAAGSCGVKTRIPLFEYGRNSMTFASSPAFRSSTMKFASSPFSASISCSRRAGEKFVMSSIRWRGEAMKPKPP